MPVAAGVAAVVFLLGAWLTDRRRRVYADLGTTPAAAVYAGRNEVKGRAWHPSPTSSHLTHTPSVWWTFVLEEERRHTRTVTSTDSDGHTSTSRVTETQFHVIDNRNGSKPWVEVVDDSGSVRVRLNGATIVERTSLSEIFERSHADSGFMASLFGRGDGPTGRYRHTERLVAVGDQLFVSGEATFNEDTARPEITGGSPFLVSTKSEEQHRRGLAVATPLLLVAALAAGAASTGSAIAVPGGIVPGLAAVTFAILGGWTIVLHNRLQSLAEQASRALSLIDVQLTRRHDLIPSIAAVARAHADHEGIVLVASALARSEPMSATNRSTPSPTDAQDAFDGELGRQTDVLRKLIAVSEAYPDLGADESFLRLQHELADTESRIAGARTFYNESVTLLRERRQTFPGVWVARFSDARRFVLIGAGRFERSVPPIEFDFPTDDQV